MYASYRLRLTAFTFAISVACSGAAKSMSALTPATVAPVLTRISFATLDKKLIDIGGESGRITVVDVWATYCKPCRTAFPKLNELASLHPEIAVIGLSVDENDGAVEQFLREVPTNITIARDPLLTVKSPPLSMQSLPTLLVLDARGRIRFRADAASERSYDELPLLIEQLTSERTD
jgi:thiol-disulfide isomerase/thioredoxin